MTYNKHYTYMQSTIFCIMIQSIHYQKIYCNYLEFIRNQSLILKFKLFLFDLHLIMIT